MKERKTGGNNERMTDRRTERQKMIDEKLFNQSKSSGPKWLKQEGVVPVTGWNVPPVKPPGNDGNRHANSGAGKGHRLTS